MSRLRHLVLGLVVLLCVDLLLIVVTGGWSLLGPWTGPVGVLGFCLRSALLTVLTVLRFRRLAAPEQRIEVGQLVLILLLLPTLLQFQFAGGRINGDGLMYYVYVRSLWKDFDLDFTNEYTHYELIDRGDLAVKTKTGLRRSIFSIGPAVIWTPFFWLGEGVARGQLLLGGEADLSGFGPTHRNAVALGSLLYGFAAVLLIHSLLRRYFDRRVAFGAALLIWGASFLHWYMVQQPTMSHAPSAFGAALAIWLWDRQRGRRSTWGYFVLGLVLGIAMCVRWQNGVLLALPGLELLGSLRHKPRRFWLRVAQGALLLLAAGIGAFPQMAAWKSLYDMWLLPYPPHGVDFVRLDHPFILNTLFSSRHGVLSWTPALWAGYLGFVPLLLQRQRQRRQLALTLLLPLLLMTYVNMCSGDWWAGGSFSNRRFDSLLPILALGIAASIEWIRRALRARPAAVLGLLGLPFVIWNATLAEQMRSGQIPRDDTVSFPRLVHNGSRILADAVGSPQTWPASWLFAYQQGRPPGQYDRLVGRYLFYRQNNMRGYIEVGVLGDEAMLGEGWGRMERHEGHTTRRVLDRARLFAPLDVPLDLEIRVRGAAVAEPRAVVLRVNGREAGRFWATTELAEHALKISAGYWHRELNDVELDVGGGQLRVDYVRFRRLGGGS